MSLVNIGFRPTKGAEVFFVTGDWVLSAGQYQLDVQHNLESEKIIIEVWENSNNIVDVGRVDIINTNTIRFYVPFDPDCRFEGKVIVHKIVS